MNILKGSCHCKNIEVEVGIETDPANLQPRSCDCDFCVKHHAAYVSDPRGFLKIQYKSESLLGLYKQGTGTADFIFCKNCGILVGVIYKTPATIYGAVHSHILEANFQEEVTVSPKKLDKQAKTQRWEEVWFPDVMLGP
ncbi:GFA family protein [Bdellovibrio sp. HCB117]|uniref:GFA family protein n=1 Tax=Bdellovibrio sp. HCB117 TaxID=3394359 RepID=UPI0039B5F348